MTIEISDDVLNQTASKTNITNYRKYINNDSQSWDDYRKSISKTDKAFQDLVITAHKYGIDIGFDDATGKLIKGREELEKLNDKYAEGTKAAELYAKAQELEAQAVEKASATRVKVKKNITNLQADKPSGVSPTTAVDTAATTADTAATNLNTAANQANTQSEIANSNAKRQNAAANGADAAAAAAGAAATNKSTLADKKNAVAKKLKTTAHKINNKVQRLGTAIVNKSTSAVRTSVDATVKSTSALYAQAGAYKVLAAAASGATKVSSALGFASPGSLLKSVGGMMALSVAVSLVTKGIEKVWNKIPTDNHVREWAEESAQALEETKGEIESIQGEIETITSRIDELESKGPLSPTEQGELDKLKFENAELERQLKLKEEIAKEESEKSSNDNLEAIKTYDKEGVAEYSRDGERVSNTVPNQIRDLKIERENLQKSYESAMSGLQAAEAKNDKELIEKYNNELDDTKEKIQEIDGEFLELVGNIEGHIGEITMEDLSGEGQEYMRDLNNQIDGYMTAKGSYSTQDRMQKILGDDYESVNRELDKLANSTEKVNEATIESIIDPAALKALEEADITIQDIIEDVDSRRTADNFLSYIIGDSRNGGNISHDKANRLQSIFDNMISDESFDITTESLEDAIDEDLLIVLDEKNVSVDSLVPVLKELQNEANNVSFKNTIDDISAIEGVMTTVGNAISEFNEDGTVTTDTMKELADSSLASVDGFDEFIGVLSDSGSSMEEVESATQSLIRSYFEESDALDNLNMDTVDLYEAELERLGVTNAHEVAQVHAIAATLNSASATREQKAAAIEAANALGINTDQLYNVVNASLSAAQTNSILAASEQLIAGSNFDAVMYDHASAVHALAIQAHGAKSEVAQLAAAYATVSELGNNKNMTAGQLSSVMSASRKITDAEMSIQNKISSMINSFSFSVPNISAPSIPSVNRGSGSSGGGGGSSKQKESPSEKRRDKYKDEKAKLDYQLNQDLISYNTYYSKLKRLGDKYYKNQSGNLADYRDHLEELAKVRKAAYNDEKSDLEYKLGMNQISYSTYYSKMQALDKKWLKGYNGNEEDHRDHLEDMAKVREDAYDNEREKLEYQLNMNQISYSTYYDNLKKLADKWLNDYDSNIEAYRDHLEDMADIRRDAFEDAREDLDKQFEDGKISASSYFSKVEALYKKWFEGYTSSKDDLIEAQDELYDTMFDHYDDRLQETIDRIDTYDFFKLYQRGKGDIDQWAKNPVDEWKYFLNEIDRALKKGSLRWEDWYDLHVEGTQQLIEAERELAEAEAERAEESKGNLDSLIDMVSEMLRHEKEEMIDALNEQADKYREITEAKKKSLDLTRAELSYQRELTDMNKDLSDLQAQAAVLKLDTSREGQAKYKELMEEISQKQQEIADKQSDHAYDATIEGLDNSVEEYEKKIEAEIEEINKLLGNAGDWLKYVYEYINSTEPSALLDELLKYNYEFGSGIDQDIHDIWDNYQNVIVDFQNKKIEEIIELLREQLKAAEEAEKAESDKDNSSENNLPFGEIISKMKANSEAMEEAKKKGDRLTYDKLEKENFELSQQLSSQSHTTWDDMTYDPETGKWTRKDGKDLYESISSKGHTSTEIIDMMERSDDPNEINKLADELREIAWYKNTFYDEKSGRWYAGINSFKKGEALFGGNTSFGPQSSSDYIETMRAMLNAGNIKGVKILIPELRKYSAYKDVFYDDYRGKIFKTGLGYSNGIPMIGSKISKPTASTYINTMKTNKSAFINNRIVPYLRKLSGYSGVYYNEKKGKWYKSKSSKTPLYHDGLKNGFVGEGEYHPTPKQDELYALLRKGELVLNKTDQDRLAVQMQVLSTLTDSLKNASSSVGSSIVNGVKGNVVLQIDAPVTIQGNADQSVVSELKKHGDMISNIALSKLNDTLNMRGYKTSAQVNARKK